MPAPVGAGDGIAVALHLGQRGEQFTIYAGKPGEELKSTGTAIVALTAHARPEDVEQALASGFHMHLAKPVDSSRLLSAVTTTLLSAWRS